MDFHALVTFIREEWPKVLAIGVLVTPVLWAALSVLFRHRLETLRAENATLRKSTDDLRRLAPAVGGNKARSNPKYDVFLSSVLAGFGDDERMREEKERALALVRCLREECGFTVYYAGEHVESAKDFDRSHLGAKRDIESLEQSRYFVLLYPERVVSSVLFEAGYAICHCDASIYFVRTREDLPYLMSRLPEAVKGLKTCTYGSTGDILKVLRQHGNNLFRDIAGERTS